MVKLAGHGIVKLARYGTLVPQPLPIYYVGEGWYVLLY